MARFSRNFDKHGFDASALRNGWRIWGIDKSNRIVTYAHKDGSTLKIGLSRYMMTIDRIYWWDARTSKYNTWKPLAEQEHISVLRIKHILNGSISPHTKT